MGYGRERGWVDGRSEDRGGNSRLLEDNVICWLFEGYLLGKGTERNAPRVIVDFILSIITRSFPNIAIAFIVIFRRVHVKMDSTIAMDDDQKRGQDFYRLKNYEAAVGCFNRVCSIRTHKALADIEQVIARNESPPSSVYDNRAAAYSKLGNLQAALRDGKRMIHAEKAKVTV